MTDVSLQQCLLYGLLGCQLGLIERESLLEAVHSWGSDQSKSLADIFVAQGALTSSQQELLDALVAEHLSKHGGAEGSLQALSDVGSLAAELSERIDDPSIRAALSIVPTDQPGQPDVTEVVHTTWADDAKAQPLAQRGETRFTLVRPHARGGLGVVSVALDTELNREVALKEIIESHADDEASRLRFVLEAEVTGGLEHPGIVPVYGLGYYADGRPYYAMRFVRGDSLEAAIDQYHADRQKNTNDGQQSVELRKLLGRFLDVCNAIEYAHSRGVLHRDLKPGNIMLGKYGETLVVDWGLARTSTSEGRPTVATDEPPLRPMSAAQSAPTMYGAAIGTPAYMSPEQARGDLDMLGPQSDVYSLGVTLYVLITGKQPFDGDSLRELLDQVKRGDYTPARTIDRSTPRQLDSICRKAMSLKPEDRYDSPLGLADDIERWMADEPVSVYRERLVERVMRWTRRHRAWTIAGAAALLLVTTTSIVATILIAAARENERRALNQANIALVAEIAAKAEAEQQRERAEQNFDKARTAVDDYFTRVSQNQLLDVPGLQPLRQELLGVALDYYEDLLQQREQDREFQVALSRAAARFANITSELEPSVSALDAHLAALGLLREQSKSTPDLRNQVDLATSLTSIGPIYFSQGELAKANGVYQEAVTILEPLLEQHSDARQVHKLLAIARRGKGTALQAEGRLAEAGVCFHDALESLKTLAEQAPDDLDIRRQLALTLRLLAGLEALTSQADTETHFQDAITTQQAVIDEQKNDIRARRMLATMHLNLGAYLHGLGRHTEAAEAYQQAFEISEKLARENPRILDYQSDLASVSHNLGNVQGDMGDFEAAMEAFGRSKKIMTSLIQLDPANASYLQTLALTHASLANHHHTRRQLAESLAANQEALELRRRLALLSPDNVRYQKDLAGSHMNIGNLQLRSGHVEEADQSYVAAEVLLEKLIERSPYVVEFQRSLCQALRNHATLFKFVDKKEESLAAHKRVTEAARSLIQQDPTAPSWQLWLVRGLAGQSEMLIELNRMDEARGTLSESTVTAQALVAAHPEAMDHHVELTSCFQRQGRLHEKAGEIEQAIQAYEQQRDAWKTIVEDHPAIGGYREQLATSDLYLANIQLATKAYTEAAAGFDSAIRQLQPLSEENPESANLHNLLGVALTNLAGIRTQQNRPTEEVLSLLRQALQHRRASFEAAPQAPIVRRLLSVAYSNVANQLRELSQHDGAMRIALERKKLWPGNSEELYNIACEIALCIPLVSEDQPSATEIRSRYADEAVKSLQQSVESGFDDIEHIRSDPDLEAIRGHETYKELTAES